MVLCCTSCNEGVPSGGRRMEVVMLSILVASSIPTLLPNPSFHLFSSLLSCSQFRFRCQVAHSKVHFWLIFQPAYYIHRNSAVCFPSGSYPSLFPFHTSPITSITSSRRFNSFPSRIALSFNFYSFVTYLRDYAQLTFIISRKSYIKNFKKTK